MIGSCQYLGLLSTFALTEFALDLYKSHDLYRNCRNDPAFYAQLLLHHFAFALIVTGWMCDDLQLLGLYLACLTWVLLDWEVNGGYCSLTLSINRRCNLKRTEYFRDFFYWMGLKTSKYGRHVYRVYMFTCLTIAIVKFWNRAKKCI